MAKPFRFRLETVLRVRRQREDAAKRVVADRLRQMAEVKAEMAAMQGQIASELDAFREAHGSGTLDMRQVARHRYWLVQLDQGVMTNESRLRDLESALAKERQELAEARKQVRILEKLEERQRERYMKELERAEAAENDEIGTVLAMRKRREEAEHLSHAQAGL